MKQWVINLLPVNRIYNSLQRTEFVHLQNMNEENSRKKSIVRKA